MTQTPARIHKVAIYSEAPGIHDLVWGCKHMLRRMVPRQFLILHAPISDLKFYFAMRRRGECRITMITLDLLPSPRLGIAIGKAEKPLYFCEECQAELLHVTRHLHCATVHIPA